ncbi:Hypothetical Protein FCC1311_080952 [Hondaea fermentalgiana]|uniref:Uncharacterized protein n=1 Tax=Hondaea fermentalgiana TaxID=2315210 RepID=A0A2R5GLW2_9STRA|nr:Hypothetical Protein FCC1311_080952 [Hondaea fermentalgiana]|eukprot:GBG31870.1 Hypothetical Protein FCC1311_080952 [Hondaea fermentalgiana]
MTALAPYDGDSGDLERAEKGARGRGARCGCGNMSKLQLALLAAVAAVVALGATLAFVLTRSDACGLDSMSDATQAECATPSEEAYTMAHLVQDWDSLDVVFPTRGQPAQSLTTSLSARFENDTYAFQVKSTAYGDAVNLPITIWIDVDLNETTTMVAANWTENVVIPDGADLAIVLDEDFAKVYTDVSASDPVLQITSAETLVAVRNANSNLNLAVGVNDGETATVGITGSAVANLTGVENIEDLMIKFQDSTNNAQEGLDAWLLFATDDLQRNPPACADRRSGMVRGAVVFSETAQARFYNDKSYNMLFMSMQNQFMQAGFPISLIYDTDLTEEAWMCDFSVIIIPYMNYVSPARAPALRKVLTRLVHRHGVSLVLSNEFMTASSETDVSLPAGGVNTLRLLSGISFSSFQLASEVVVRASSASTASGAAFADLEDNQVIVNSTVNTGFSPYLNVYSQASDMTGFEITELARADLTNTAGAQASFAPILASRLLNAPEAGRVIHLASIDLLADFDLGWRLIRWAAQTHDTVANGPHAYLQLTRHDSIFVVRWDCDLTSFLTAAPTVYPTMQSRFIDKWREEWDMVASYYINLGDNLTIQRGTNWTFSKPLYANWIEDGNELGSHSFTHPLYVNDLNATQLDYEFGLSNQYISGNMSLDRIGAAQPGNPLNLASDTAMEKYYSSTYFSTSVSKSGAGYEGAFGFMTPLSKMVLMAPNLSFDFTFIEYQHLTTTQAEAAWLQEFDLATRFANRPIIHAGVHPYAVVSYTYNSTKQTMELDSGLYSSAMFESLFETAYASNTEFLPLMTLNDRIRSYKSAWFRVVQLNGSALQVIVSSDDDSTEGFGAFALTMPDPALRIVSVDNWYAYSARDVFLPKAGGSFIIRTGALSASPLACTRITEMSMRVKLESLTGDCSSLTATLQGPGKVRIDLAGDSSSYTISGATVALDATSYVELTLVKGSQTVAVSVA